MEQRVRHLQFQNDYRRSNMRYPFHHEVEPPPQPPPSVLPPQPPRHAFAPVPLEPWDREAILDYRSRVNANSARPNIEFDHHPHRNGSLQRGGGGGGLMLLEEEAAERDRLRPRLRDIPPSPTQRLRGGSRQQDYRGWPQRSFRQEEPHFFLKPQVSGHSNPSPNPLFRRLREEEDDAEAEEFRMRKRPKFGQFGLANDSSQWPRNDRFVSYSPSRPHPHPQPQPQPQPDIYLPSPVPQAREKWEHDLFEHNHTHSRERDGDFARLREISSSVRAEHHPSIPALPFDDEMVLLEHQHTSVHPKELTDKDQVLPFRTSTTGPLQSEARKGKVQGKGVGVQSKKVKNKTPPWPQAGKKKGKLKKSTPSSGLQGKTSKVGSISDFQGERTTADLSVVFRRSGMVAQEVVVSSVDDCARTRRESRASLEEEDTEEEGEIKVTESGQEEKRFTDHQDTASQWETESMALISETVSPSKDLFPQGVSVEASCFLQGLENQTSTVSATPSQERLVTLHKHLPFDCRENGTPTAVKANQSDIGPPFVELLPTCTPSLKLEKDFSVTAPSEPKLSLGETQEVGSQVTSLTPSNSKAVDRSDVSEGSRKKMKVEQIEKPALNSNERMESPLFTSSVLQAGGQVTESHGPIAGDQMWLNRILRSNVTQQSSGAYQIQSSQPDRKSSQNPIAVPTFLQSKSSFIFPPPRAKVTSSSVHAGRSRTWHRTDNATSSSALVKPRIVHNEAASGGQAVTKVENSQSSAYVRKRNGLVRAACPPKSSLPGSLYTGKASTQKSYLPKGVSVTGVTNTGVRGLGSNVGSSGPPSATAFKISAPALERPITPPLVSTVEPPAGITGSPRSFVPAVVSGTPTEVHVLTTDAPVADDFKVHNENIPILTDISNENQVNSDSSNNLLLCKSNLNEDHIENAGTAQMIYVKRKSNQLIAAPTCKSQGSTAILAEGGQLPLNCLAQDHYYKRKKNQIVRSNLPVDRKMTKAVEVPGISSSLDMELKGPTLKDQRGMAFFQTKLGRVLKHKKHCTSQSSWVWTLGKEESSTSSRLQSRRVAPLLFPWKRPSYGKSGFLGKLKAVPSINKGSSLSLISKKLKRLRKRDTVYTKSSNGFSLRRSGVLSFGGSNLKWTKSIEKRSKQTSEAITLAVAAAEKKKREEKAVCTDSSEANAEGQSSKPAQGTKLRARKSRDTPGERILQVGLFRYKRDPSKRTLQMIPAEESTSSLDMSLASHTLDKAKLFTPRRLSIIGDEYLRVGNGNKLVRDPKKVCRVLASEKVRWSLHTARCRLAKKQQYCQFFTRFGKCNKEDGKCPYIHDREKVAVCTKFLKGNCSNANCELTHKIIPERMEDCSYFLQGFCTNENCPYRHVNVNSKAPVCDGFLKGYCSEGDKCNKKHTYVCLRYAATGECPERSCKLHHPKKKEKLKVSRKCKGGTNAKRRYFVSDDLGISELVSALLRLHSEQQTVLELPSRAPECVEFISLDSPDEDVNDNDLVDSSMSPMKRTESGFLSNLGLRVDDIDMMIRPFRLLQKDQAVNTSMDQGC